MINWLGQEIVEGSWVYRGARDGNTSSFKVGKVVSINGTKVRVNWKFEPAYSNFWFERAGMDKQEYESLTIEEIDSFGSPSLDSLVLVDFNVQEVFRLAARRKALIEKIREHY